MSGIWVWDLLNSQLHDRTRFLDTIFNPYANVIEIMGEVVENIPGADDFVSFSFGSSVVLPICKQHECPTFPVFLQRYLQDVQKGGVGGTVSEANSSCSS
jgi:hypothetical protein